MERKESLAQWIKRKDVIDEFIMLLECELETGSFCDFADSVILESFILSMKSISAKANRAIERLERNGDFYA